MSKKRVWTSDEKRIVAARNEWKCCSCKKLLGAAFEVDHILPLEDGGSNDLGTNAQALCSNCHSKKTQLERVARIQKAKQKLAELRDEPVVEKRAKRTEDVVLDPENPFAKYCFLA
jgi:5-methylcytosine-specific restriction endonuclease McrA